MADDLEAIKRQVEFMRMQDRFAKRLNMGSTPTMAAFSDAAYYLNGDTKSTFRVLRSLRRICDSRDVRWLIAQARDTSSSRWHLKINRRVYTAMTDGGAWIRNYDREKETNRIGMAFYELHLSGISAEHAYEDVRNKLKLNLSDRTLKDRLKKFRALAKRNGFVDSDAPFMGWLMSGYVSKPKITVAQISKRGRPKKGAIDD
jgi:hypothetical protein